LPEFKSVLELAKCSPEEQFHRLAEAIRKAALPLCSWHQLLADKCQEKRFQDSLASGLAESIRSIMAIVTGLRTLAKELAPPAPCPNSDVASSASALLSSQEPKVLLELAKLSPAELVDHVVHEIGNAMVPLATHQQLLADKWKEEEFRASLNAALVHCVKRVTALINKLRYCSASLGWTPVSRAPTQGVTPEQIGKALASIFTTKSVGPRVAIADTPVADLTLNELHDEHTRLCAARELGRPTLSDLARLQEVISRIQYLEWGYEI
jgi:hypothetical protein